MSERKVTLSAERHEGSLAVTGGGYIWFVCTCGWECGLGYDPKPTDATDAQAAHLYGLALAAPSRAATATARARSGCCSTPTRRRN